MNSYEIINETSEEINVLDLEKIIESTLSLESVNNAIFNIIIVDNKTIKEINKQYRNKDVETDVISFALEDNVDITLDFRVLGDIYISIDKAKSQSIEYGHSLKRELCFLTVHGLLHLLGYDHMNEKEEKVMFDRQKEILDLNEVAR